MHFHFVSLHWIGNFLLILSAYAAKTETQEWLWKEGEVLVGAAAEVVMDVWWDSARELPKSQTQKTQELN